MKLKGLHYAPCSTQTETSRQRTRGARSRLICRGVVTQIEEKQATVILTNGIILRDIPINMPDDPDTLQTQKRDTYNHRLVSITQSGETAVLTKCSFSNKTTGEWTIADNKLGSKLVSPRVHGYEGSHSGAPA